MPRLLISFIAVIFTTTGFAREPAGDYPYPYKDPYLATLTSALLKGDRDDPKIVAAVTTNYLTLSQERAAVDEFDGQRQLVFKLYRQKGPAPLVYVLGGIGANVFSGTSRYTADALFRDGFHVIILPSPFNWNFTLTASSSGLPGITDEDAVDIYNVMKATLAVVKSQYGIEVTRFGAVGFSLGALQLAWVSEVDRIDNELGLERFLLVNPPVDLIYALDHIEELSSLQSEVGANYVQRLIAYAFGFVLEAWQGDVNDPAYFADLDKRFKVAERGRRVLIGYAMQLTMDDTISVSETINRRELVSDPSPLATELLGQARPQNFTFGRYMNEIVLPVWAERLDQDDPLETLRERVDLLPILDRLASNEEVYLMHNADDFIVNGEHLERVKAALGDRATIYPAGGHLGNLWFEPNRQALSKVFADLKN